MLVDRVRDGGGVRAPGIAARLGLVALLALATGCAVPVASALEEGDANDVVVLLDQSGIDATKEVDPTTEGRFRVTVMRDDSARAMAMLADEQVPRPHPKGVLASVGQGQLVPSQVAEHAQLVAGMAGELERTLGEVEGVRAARVHLSVPPKDPLRDGPPARTTASVLLEHRGTTPPLSAESVQRLVAGGTPNLAPADVAVVFVPRAQRPASKPGDVAHVGPIAVARASATTLKAALAGLVLLVLVLASAALAFYARMAKALREQEEALAAAPSRAPAAMTRPMGTGTVPPGHTRPPTGTSPPPRT
ncbi:MAG: hypothetical protein KC657_26605 [Myxococcales bacterium]|nr:hypothetical protein [Myxococcales bacterium]